MLKTTTVRPLVTRTGSALGNVWRRSAILAQVAAFVRISHCANDGLACGYRVQYSLRRVGLMIRMCRHYVYTWVRCQQLLLPRGQAGTSNGSAASPGATRPDWYGCYGCGAVESTRSGVLTMFQWKLRAMWGMRAGNLMRRAHAPRRTTGNQAPLERWHP